MPSSPSGYSANYVTVIAPKDSSIRYTTGKLAETGTSYPETELKNLPSTVFSGWTEFGTQGYVFGYLTLRGGTHYLKSEKPFGLTGYGFYPYTSYGYPIGLELKKINNTN